MPIIERNANAGKGKRYADDSFNYFDDNAYNIYDSGNVTRYNYDKALLLDKGKGFATFWTGREEWIGVPQANLPCLQ